jgi:hypothetical protein
MTASPSPSERLAIRTANAALLDSPNASCDIVATIVFALGAAGLLRDDEPAEPQSLTARELQRAAHFTEAARLLEGRYDEDAVNFLDTMAGGIAAMANEVAAIEDPARRCTCARAWNLHSRDCALYTPACTTTTASGTTCPRRAPAPPRDLARNPRRDRPVLARRVLPARPRGHPLRQHQGDPVSDQRIVIDVDRDGWTDGLQLNIAQLDENDTGHGYRLAGPKYNGSSENLLRRTLDERDARKIRQYLDAVFPQEAADDEPAVTPTVANHVLWSEGHGGYPPEPFTTALLAAWSGADYVNSARLAAGWPDYAAAFAMLTEPNGLEKLRAIAAGGAS